MPTRIKKERRKTKRKSAQIEKARYAGNVKVLGKEEQEFHDLITKVFIHLHPQNHFVDHNNLEQKQANNENSFT